MVTCLHPHGTLFARISLSVQPTLKGRGFISTSRREEICKEFVDVFFFKPPHGSYLISKRCEEHTFQIPKDLGFHPAPPPPCTTYAGVDELFTFLDLNFLIYKTGVGKVDVSLGRYEH